MNYKEFQTAINDVVFKIEDCEKLIRKLKKELQTRREEFKPMLEADIEQQIYNLETHLERYNSLQKPEINIDLQAMRIDNAEQEYPKRVSTGCGFDFVLEQEENAAMWHHFQQSLNNNF